MFLTNAVAKMVTRCMTRDPEGKSRLTCPHMGLRHAGGRKRTCKFAQVTQTETLPLHGLGSAQDEFMLGAIARNLCWLARKEHVQACRKMGGKIDDCVTGHMSLDEIERYTRAARKKKLADAAIAKLK